MSNSPIFIVGCPRSGTTLLRDLLRSHPNISFPHESHFIPNLYRAYGDPKNDHEAYSLASIILNLQWVKSWGLSLDPALFSGYRSYSQIVSRIYEEWLRKENKSRWGDKTPQYVTEIPTILEIFPSCKIIHLYRDGRDVALSLIPTYFGQSNVYTAASHWKRLVTEGRRMGRSFGPKKYLEIRYEDLLDQPKETLQQICEFIEEKFTQEMLRLNILKRKGYPKLIGEKVDHYDKRRYIDSTNQARWKVDMSLKDRIIFESVAGDLLNILGYQVENLYRPISSVERNMWKARNFVWFVLKYLNRGQKWRWLPSTLKLKWTSILHYSKMK